MVIINIVPLKQIRIVVLYSLMTYVIHPFDTTFKVRPIKYIELNQCSSNSNQSITQFSKLNS